MSLTVDELIASAAAALDSDPRNANREVNERWLAQGGPRTEDERSFGSLPSCASPHGVRAAIRRVLSERRGVAPGGPMIPLAQFSEDDRALFQAAWVVLSERYGHRQ